MHPKSAMRLRILAVGVLLAVPLAAVAQTPANPDPTKPDFSMIVQGTFDPETLAEFNRRVQDYAALRSRLEVGLPPLVVTTNADEIETLRAPPCRADSSTRAARGADSVSSGDGRTGEADARRSAVDAATIAAIMDDGPGEFDVDVNETYTKKHALATMPPNLLLRAARSARKTSSTASLDAT